jgi:protein-tyrosine phosphatase
MIGAFFLTLGIAYLALGSHLGLLGTPISWLGVSCAVVGVAHLVDRPGLMGKRPDGRFHPLGLVVHAPYLLLVWLSWQARRRRREACFDEISPGLFLGRMAAPDELPKGVGLVVDLTCELSEPRPIREGNYRCLPTLDGGAPERERFVSIVQEVARFEGGAFVHCAAGHGRSAALVAGVLLAKGIAGTVEEAEALLKEKRRGVSLTRAQRRLLRECESALRPAVAAEGE